MDIGLLFYDDDKKRTLTEKVERAAAFYQSKYGVAATECYINPKMLENHPGMKQAGGLKLHPSRTVIFNHFWLGAETK